MSARAIAAADANREFSSVLRQVRNGATFTVTSHGRAVARIVPVRASEHVATRGKAALLKRLRGGKVVDVDRWTRDELYE